MVCLIYIALELMDTTSYVICSGLLAPPKLPRNIYRRIAADDFKYMCPAQDQYKARCCCTIRVELQAGHNLKYIKTFNRNVRTSF